jgi:hypothetical protein
MKREGVKEILALIGIVMVAFLLLLSMRTYWEQPDTLESETDYIWVDFDVTGFIRVEVTDTNCGEVPDEAWEEARRVLGEFGNYASLDLSVKDYGHYTEVIAP